MKQNRVRTSAIGGGINNGTTEFQGKSELQRKLQSMVVACRDNNNSNTIKTTNEINTSNISN